MKYLKLFESFNDQKFVWLKIRINSICREWGIKNYTINKDGSIDVSGDVNLSYKGLSELPLKFRNITGDFFCDNNKLTSLEGCPQTVGGSFWCDENQLTSLEGCPQTVGDSFLCDNNKLTSLEGCPQTVGGTFYCYNNPCSSIYEEWIDTDRRDELLDMMKDYDFLRGEIINWYLLEAFFNDAGLEIPDKEELEKHYTIED